VAEKRKGKVVEFYNYDDVRTVRSAGTDQKNLKCWTRTNVTQSQVKSGLGTGLECTVRPSLRIYPTGEELHTLITLPKSHVKL
jgi:hypothetical protein